MNLERLLFIFKFLVVIIRSFSYATAKVGLNEVIDISQENGNFDARRVKVQGIKGVFHKATHGTSYNCDDRLYEDRKQNVRSVELLWGAYHVGSGESGTKQAQHFLEFVGDDPNILLALFIVPNKRQTCGGQITLPIAEEFVTIIYNVRGRYPLIYGGDLLKTMLKGKENTVLRKCPLWISEYGANPTSPISVWSTWTMWQYTDGYYGFKPNKVAGVGYCSRDVINVDVHASTALLWKNAGRWIL